MCEALANGHFMRGILPADRKRDYDNLILALESEIERPCDDCGGVGDFDGFNSKCKTCDGTGKVKGYQRVNAL